MKGLSFQNGVEYKINIDGESWAQGDSISVTLESKTPSSLTLYLAEGVDRKVKAKTADAFTVLEKFTAEASPLKQSIALPVGARISDKTGSLYVLYGKEEQPEKLGQLRLNVIPHLLIRELIEVMTAHFRFAQKTTSAGKNDEVEVKLDPPGSKEWASLEQLLIRAQMTEETMEVYFQFNRSEVDPTKGGLSSMSVRREITRAWNRNEIVHDFNQRLNKEVVTASLEAVFEEYRSAGWLAQ